MHTWKFKPYGEGETKTNPTESEFFATTEVNNVATGIVREGIQNSLDEKQKKSKGPVRVRIALSGKKFSLQPAQYKKYLDGLIPHLTARANGLRGIPDFNTDALQYLTFEDFNTNGLLGEPNESKNVEVEDVNKDHNFYYFWRNVGITGKPEDKLGRWGIGKTVFPAASKINTFWGLTLQSDTNTRYLLGQSVLKSHDLTPPQTDYGYRPYGYYAEYDQGSMFPKAIEDSNILDAFSFDFRLKRQHDDPGLSLVVPFCRDEVNMQSIITAVILQYYLAIIKNQLVVEVSYEDLELEIKHDNLDAILIAHYNEDLENIPSKQDVSGLFEFTRWALSLGSAQFNKLQEVPVNNQPRWVGNLWGNLKIDDLVTEYESEGKIAFLVPMKFHKANSLKPPKTCWFKVFIQKDETLKKAEVHFVRDNLTIIDVKSIKNPGIRAMVLIDDSDLSNLLGDSENPAHTQWQKGSQNFLDKYIHGDKCIDFVINSLANIYPKLLKPAVGIDRTLLREIFFIPEDNVESQEGDDDDSHKDNEPTKKDATENIPVGKRKMIRVKKILGGIEVTPSNLTHDRLPEIVIKLAYDTTRGNPLRKYNPFDFALNKLPIKTKLRNCLVAFPDSNAIKLTPTSTDFELTIVGFDVNRDLFVDVNTIYPENDSEI